MQRDGNENEAVDHILVPSTDAIEQVCERWEALIGEYEALRDALREHVGQPHWPGVDPYISMLKTQLTNVRQPRVNDGDGVSKADPRRDAAINLATTNVAAREVLWNMTKKCRGLLSLERWFLKSSPGQRTGRAGQGTDGVFVNAVVDDGRTWLRVVATTEAKLMLELAEHGWEFTDRRRKGSAAADDGEVNANDNSCGSNEDVDISTISIVKLSFDLMDAARANLYKKACPDICVVLSRVNEGRNDDIDMFLRRLRFHLFSATATGNGAKVDGSGIAISIHCANSSFSSASPPPLNVALEQLMPMLSDDLTETVNVDTSILIALVSDMTHSHVEPQLWHPVQRVSEIRQEAQRPGRVLRTLGEVLRGRHLVCTQEAASAFRKMVDAMGQTSERKRAAALMGDERNANSAALVQQLRNLSDYPAAIPDQLRLPVAAADEPWDVARIQRAIDAGDLPAAARHAMTDKSLVASPTLSVFCFGWASGVTTVSRNVAAKRRIRSLLEQHRATKDEKGPAVWVCQFARSLNGTQRQPAAGCVSQEQLD